MGAMCIVAYAALAYIIVKIGRAIYDVLFPYVVAPMLGLSDKLYTYCQKGEWAVVTGSTDGIGKGYAKQLAKRGINLVLISRSQEKLEATAKEIKDSYKDIEVRTVAFDFTEANHKAYDTIRKALKGLTISLLVNNVGMSYERPEVLDQMPGGDECVRNVIVVNTISAALMCRMVLPEMKERGRGAIVNVASGSALSPTPYLTIYSATKKFLAFMTEGLEMEYLNSGIYFQCVYPFFVATKMSKIRKSSFFAPDPEFYANSAIGTIGIQTSTVGCLAHGIQAMGISLLPDFAVRSITLTKMKELREKALRMSKTQ